MKSLYFPHDYSTRSDERVVKLLREKGWNGYGLYWAIVEMLHQNDGWLTTDCKVIAYDLRSGEDEIKSIIRNYDLFVFKKNKFTSNRVLNNLEYRQSRSDKAKQSAEVRWSKKKKEDDVKIPTVAEIAEYCKERKNGIDPEGFFSFYDSKGWMVGKNKMVKWKAAIITWEKNRTQSNSPSKHIEELN